MWVCSINNPRFLKKSFFETLYIAIRHLVLVTHECFISINASGVCDKKNWAKIICVHIFYESLNVFQSMRQKFWIFSYDLLGIFELQIRNGLHKMILYTQDHMYIWSQKENSNISVPLSFRDMFNWKGSIGYFARQLFLTPQPCLDQTIIKKNFQL